jgi:outer membrane protein insertion porin family
MTRRLLILCAALFCAPSVLPSQDQQYDGKIVKRIDFIGLVRLTPDGVKTQMGLKEGRPFTRDLLQADVKLLVDRKIFLTIVRASVKPFEDGVAIEIVGEENARVIEVAFWGLTGGAEADELKPLIKTVRGGLVDQFTLDVDRQAIIDYYRAKGYHYVQVTVEQSKLSASNPQANACAERTEGLMIVFNVTEGPLVEISCVRFEGNCSFTKPQLLKAMQHTAETGFLKDAPFVLMEVQRDVVALNRYYQGQGFLNAKVTLLGFTPSANFSRVTVRIGIEEGEPFIVRSIRIEGMTRFDPHAFQRCMETKVNCRYQPGVGLARDIRNLVKKYEDCAYLQVDVRDASTVDIECPQVDVLLRVSEGEVNYVGEVVIEGNLATRDNVLRREIQLYSGMPLSREKFERAKQRIARLDYWEQTPDGFTADIGDTPNDRYQTFRQAFVALRDTKRENVKDILVNVKERDTGSLRFAVGVGSNTGLIGDITYQKDNFDASDWPESWSDIFDAFTGGGDRLTLSAQPGTQVSRLYASYFNPRVADTEWSFRQDAYLNYAIREKWHEQRIGFASSVGRRLSDEILAGLTIRNEWVEELEVRDDAPDIVKEFHGRELLASLQLGLRYSKVDNILDPTDGLNAGFTFEHAGLWGDLFFNRAEANAEWFIPLHEDEDNRWHVLRLKGQLGWESEYGDSTDIPIYERFFAGGAHSIRGFSYRGIGPMEGGTTTGGKALWTANAEYAFPLLGVPRPGAPSLRGVFFVDTGSLAEDWGDDDIGKVRASIGFGVRVVVPFLGPRPVAVDFGFPIVKHDGDETQLISFSFGSNF